jgi:hypothetical protein
MSTAASGRRGKRHNRLSVVGVVYKYKEKIGVLLLIGKFSQNDQIQRNPTGGGT